MKSDSGKSVSCWMHSVDFPSPISLPMDEKADVCVIGSGIAGLCCAYLLMKEGKSVIILDDGPIAGGETCRTTAHLTSVVDDHFIKIEKMHGEKGLKLAIESHMRAIDCIEEIVNSEKIDCEFERLDGYLFASIDETPDLLDREYAVARRSGMKYIERVARAPLGQFRTGQAIKFQRQAQLHPLKFIQGLLQCVLRRGGRIFKAHADSVKGGSPAQVLTSHGFKVTSEAVIVATNTPFNDWVVIHTKQAAYRTYVIAATIPKGSVTRALYWDMLNPYHYVRLENLSDVSDLLIIGGEDHKTGQPTPSDPHRLLKAWALERFPMIESFEYCWSGQVMQPVDGIAFIGRNPMDEQNVYVTTGDSGQGMTYGMIAGILLTDMIVGRKNEWEELYHPNRKTLSATWEFVLENANTIAQYADWFKSGEVDSLMDIPPGMGAIMREGLKKFAVYHDKNGTFFKLSAVCPHLGGIVAWNDKEKTWDCPCHGSRFNTRGKVVNGPSVMGLENIDITESDHKNDLGPSPDPHSWSAR